MTKNKISAPEQSKKNKAKSMVTTLFLQVNPEIFNVDKTTTITYNVL
jgi:hypothetical protein